MQSFEISSSQLSPQQQREEEEEEEVPSTSWRKGMPRWLRTFQQKNARRQRPKSRRRNQPQEGIENNTATGAVDDDMRYYGGIMRPAQPPHDDGITDDNLVEPATPRSRQSHRNPHHPASPPASPGLFQRSFSYFSRSSNAKGGGDDSLIDFEDSEWTPQDSAYGAACPVCGWIPKEVRRMIEFTLIAVMVVGFVYLVVTTSIKINNERSKFHTSNNSTSASDYRGQIVFDDDLYVENTNSGYYNNNNNNQGGGDDDTYAAGDDDTYNTGDDDGGGDDTYDASSSYSNTNNNDDDLSANGYYSGARYNSGGYYYSSGGSSSSSSNNNGYLRGR